MNNVPRLSFWQMLNMAIGFLGIQFAWSIQMGQMSGIYERLGATPQQVSWFWIAGPITGMIIQPIVGHLSDNTWSRLGRRRPYFLVGAILASIVLLAMPNSPSLWVAASLLWIMDASINISMEPFRALVADVAPKEQRGTAYSFQSFAIGLGSVISFGIGGMMILEWLENNAGFSLSGTIRSICPTSVHALFYIGAVVFMTAIIWTVATTKEYPPENMQEFLEKKKKKGTIVSIFVDTWKIILEMPSNMKKLCLVHSLTWFAFFCMFIFFSPMVAANIFQAEPGTTAYDEGIAWASLCYLALNLICFTSSPAIGLFTKKFKKKTVHTVNLLLGGAALVTMYFARTPVQAMLAMAVVGIAWASTLSLPYAILSGIVPRSRYGIFMGAFNIFICLPQIVCALFTGPIVAFAGGNKAVAMVLGGISMLIGAALMKRVYEPGAEEERASLEKAAEPA